MFFRIDRFINAESCRQKAAGCREEAAAANGQSGSFLALAEILGTFGAPIRAA
jgi:hypothetical protein